MTADLSRHFLLDPSVAFLNHGSYGACPRPVMDAYRHWQEALERQPVAFMEPSHLAARFAEVRRALGAELGAQPDDLVWVTNATAGLNIVARSLDLRQGDEVLTSDHEYAALAKTWAFAGGTSAWHGFRCRATPAAMTETGLSPPCARRSQARAAVSRRSGRHGAGPCGGGPCGRPMRRPAAFCRRRR
ncbi:aminotransferase class V-fold PLP-dependent enzyme [Albidovulum sp.]|uniref:aminotransferase class V-fold PLP-dependent enzyme n=1 Tax=Albidovulum sp. TaxID=1872424 RepID=UPI0030331018